MNISWNFIKGLSVGLEYVELDEDDQKDLETEGNLMVILSLGLVRIVAIS